ncbi:hypothetical protein PG994_012857 [Apiospora phragmitis]|uniref:Uncharacterized protein n=1 Tax=Apiospora phragmitis TaxID=2905665 RepID=A0ABR1T6Z9_9PEZI
MTALSPEKPPQLKPKNSTYGALKAILIIVLLFLLVLVVEMLFLGWLLYRQRNASRARRSRRRQEQRRLEDGLDTSEEAEKTPLLPDDSVNYSSISPLSPLEESDDASYQGDDESNSNGRKDQDVVVGHGDDEAYIYGFFAPRTPQLLPQLAEHTGLQHYVERQGLPKTRVRDVLHHRLESRQRAAAEAAGTVGMRLGGQRSHREGFGEVIEICWET